MAGKVLSFDDIDNFDDTVTAEVEAFGGTVLLVSLGAELLGEYLEERASPDSVGMRNTLLTVYSMLTEEERSGSKAERRTLVYDRTRKLRKKNLDTLAALTKKALEINGLSKEESDARKNESGGAPSGASPTV